MRKQKLTPEVLKTVITVQWKNGETETTTVKDAITTLGKIKLPFFQANNMENGFRFLGQESPSSNVDQFIKNIHDMYGVLLGIMNNQEVEYTPTYMNADQLS